MIRHRAALATIAAAAVLDIAGGLGFAAAERLTPGAGLYWAVTTATTVGYGDVVPRTAAGHVVAVAVMLTVIPLFAATFSLFTSGLTRVHVRRDAGRAAAAAHQIAADLYRRYTGQRHDLAPGDGNERER